MQNLPTPEIYEKEFTYMPWGTLIREVQLYVFENLPKGGAVLDLLCGPGYLLDKIKKKRSDAICHGVDFEPDFIDFARIHYPKVGFELADANVWKSNKKFDAVIITAGLHHLRRRDQELFIKKVSKLITKNGFVIFGDPYIGDYKTEQERKGACARLGYEYLKFTIDSGGTDDVIDAAIQVMVNDINEVEYKTSVVKMMPVFKKYFRHIETHKTWPKEDGGYGDYYFILRT